MHNPSLIKNFVAGAHIDAFRLVKLDGDEIILPVGDGDVAIGVVELEAEEGDRIDVILSGIAEVQSDGDIRSGQPVCAGPDGRIKSAGPNAPVFGYALERGGRDECVGVLISHHYMPAPQD